MGECRLRPVPAHACRGQNVVSIVEDSDRARAGKMLSRNSSLQYPDIPPFPMLRVTVARTV